MPRNRCLRFARLTLFALVPGLALAAPPAEVPHRYNPVSLDGALVSARNPVDGTQWSAWAYRDGAEYDIAVSRRDRLGRWSEPTFLQRLDGRDQVQPSIAFDLSGNLYVAYTVRPAGRIELTALRYGTETWLSPHSVTRAGERGATPALHAVADRLVVAFRSGRAVAVRDVPLLPAPVSTHGVHDGPDPFGVTPNGGSRGGGGGNDGDDGDSDGSESGDRGAGSGGFIPQGWSSRTRD